MQRTKLLFVMAAMNRGGAERSLINLLELLDQNRYEIDLLVFDQRGALMAQIPAGINVLQPDREVLFLSYNDKRTLLSNVSLRGILGRIRYMLSKSGCSNYVRSQKKWRAAFLPAVMPIKKEYDTAIAFMHSLPSYFVMDKVRAKKKILWVHNDYSRLADGQDFDRAYFEAADGVITISEQCVEALEKVFPDLIGKFKCIYNLNPAEKIRKKADAYFPEEYMQSEGAKIISVGRLNSQKGFDYAIAAAQEMKNKGFPFHWFIIGEGELRGKLAEQIETSDVKNCVTLLGARENPYPYIKNADIVAQTSRYEGKSIVLDEAKILYKPIVSTDYLSVHDQIEDGVTGVIVDLNPTSIADGIIALMQDEAKCEALKNRLRSETDITRALLDKYEEVFALE